METITLPADIQSHIAAFKTSKAAFEQTRDQIRDLKANAEKQKSLAQDYEQEAAQHEADLRQLASDLVRAGTGDKTEIERLSGKQQTAAALAKECEKFSNELLEQAEFLNDVALAHAEN